MRKDANKITSINFEEKTYKDAIKKAEAANKTLSRYTNDVLQVFNSLDDSVRLELAAHSHQKSVELMQEAAEQKGFEHEALQAQAKQYMDLVNLFTDGKGLSNPNYHGMQRHDISIGYMVCPEEWIYIDYCSPEDAKAAYVIEFKNAEKYNLPYFFFFKEDYTSPTAKEEDKIMDKVAEISKEYKKARAQFPPAQYSTDGRLLNAKELNEQPIPGIFPIPKFGNRDDYPFGAMVVERTKEVD